MLNKYFIDLRSFYYRKNDSTNGQNDELAKKVQLQINNQERMSFERNNYLPPTTNRKNDSTNGQNDELATKCPTANKQPRKNELQKKQLPTPNNESATDKTTTSLDQSKPESDTDIISVPRTVHPKLNMVTLPKLQ